MDADESFNQYLDKVVKHYSSLFKLPSYKSIILLSSLVCIAGGLLSAFIFLNPHLGLVSGVLLGFSLLFITKLFNYLSVLFILKNDPIYDLRRTAALSLFCWFLWVFFILMGYIMSAFAASSLFGIRLCLLGFSAVLILRFIVLYATASSSYKRLFLASILQPFLCLTPIVVLWWLNGFNVIAALSFSFYALAVAFISSICFTSLLNFVGIRSIGEKSLPIFKAFLLNWVADLNAPFEVFLEKVSEEQDVEVSIVRFDCYTHKAFIVVPSVHPGPFKNIGSSLLPSMLKTALEQKFNCVACVPLGLLGHELDVTSQNQTKRIIDDVLKSASFEANEDKASPFIRVSNGLATACCQIFGKVALISFSLAPNTTEDLPQELGAVVRRESEKLGLKSCIVVNAHNSIDGAVDAKTAAESLESVAVACLKKAVSVKTAPFKVGAATFAPREFSLMDGMGPGGITVIAVKVGAQKIAYVIIDGNNMVSGLREKILESLKSVGFNEGEVFTTDTHAVNALTFNERGYHPIGEVIDPEKLISYIVEVAKGASVNLEKAKVGYHSKFVPKVKVIGRKPLEKLCVLTDKVIQTSKKIAVPLFGATFLALMLVLLYV